MARAGAVDFLKWSPSARTIHEQMGQEWPRARAGSRDLVHHHLSCITHPDDLGTLLALPSRAAGRGQEDGPGRCGESTVSIRLAKFVRRRRAWRGQGEAATGCAAQVRGETLSESGEATDCSGAAGTQGMRAKDGGTRGYCRGGGSGRGEGGGLLWPTHPLDWEDPLLDFGSAALEPHPVANRTEKGDGGGGRGVREGGGGGAVRVARAGGSHGRAGGGRGKHGASVQRQRAESERTAVGDDLVDVGVTFEFVALRFQASKGQG